MSKGSNKVSYVGSGGQAVPQGIGSGYWNYLFATSLVKDAKWNIGDRVVLPDSRVFRYGKASNIVATTSFGIKFWSKLSVNGVDYVTGADIQAELTGSSTLYITDAVGHTLDELRGGYVIVHTHAGDHNDQFRGIIGNTASTAGGKITIHLEAPLERAILATYGVEVHANPYGNLRCNAPGARGGTGGDVYSSVAGIPNVTTVAANQYLWIQTWGPRWVNPQGLAAAQTDRRGVWFDYEGNIKVANADVVTESLQYAGFLMDREVAGGTGSPLVMLQISP